MKKYIFLTTVFCSILTFQCNAQKLTSLQVKNHGFRIAKPGTKIMIKHHTHKQITGPRAKNSKPWADDCKVYPVVAIKRKNLHGPKAKNTSILSL